MLRNFYSVLSVLYRPSENFIFANETVPVLYGCSILILLSSREAL